MSGRAEGRCVLVCVTGCIAAYKACELVRILQKEGARVKVLMSEHATQFIGPTTFRALTHEKVAIGLFDDPSDPIHHVSLAKEADCIVVAPATANIIAKMAHGIADDLMSTTLLAATGPIVVAPAMNVNMWKAAATQENVCTIRARGVRIVGPGRGYLACGDVDEGRLTEVSEIADAVMCELGATDTLAGERIVITAGGTHEPIDPVRYIGNRSSGKMGVALAREARAMGAHVTLVLGPATEPAPAGVDVVPVETAAQMLEATQAAFSRATMLICAAAVADYRPAKPASRKLKKGIDELESIQLEQTDDILARLSHDRGDRIVIGFAAETGNPIDYAQQKLARKGCDAIVANDVSRSDSGFGSDTNKAWWITANATEELPLLSKSELARTLLIRAHDLRS